MAFALFFFPFRARSPWWRPAPTAACVLSSVAACAAAVVLLTVLALEIKAQISSITVTEYKVDLTVWFAQRVEGANSMVFFWPKNYPQNRPKNWPEMTFEKDIRMNYQNWTKNRPELYCKFPY